MDTRKFFFSNRVLEAWNALPPDVVMPVSVELAPPDSADENPTTAATTTSTASTSGSTSGSDGAVSKSSVSTETSSSGSSVAGSDSGDSSDSTNDSLVSTTSGASAFWTAHFYLISFLLALSTKLCYFE
ncbi:hypothetical protein SprV_0401425300 [Sparganum proliferum]